MKKTANFFIDNFLSADKIVVEKSHEANKNSFIYKLGYKEQVIKFETNFLLSDKKY